jgi:Iron-containing redox enzyme
MQLPRPCGPVSRRVVECLSRPTSTGPMVALGVGPVLTDRDVQLALWSLFELSYRGFDGVDPRREWDVGLIELRLLLESRMESELRAATRARVADALARDDDIGDLVLDLVADDDGPQISSYLRRSATADQMRDYLRERSVQQLKESDPQAFLLPRLTGAAKVALAELQYDEFGGGRPEHLHQTLYARTLAAAGLDDAYGAYIDDVSAISLASANVMSLFGLNRRLLAAGVGHFAAFEASSSVPSRRVARGLERLGLGAAADYFDEHVEADAVHESLAAHDLAAALAEDDPEVGGDILFGARAMTVLDARVAERTMADWAAGRTSLLRPLDPVAA